MDESLRARIWCACDEHLDHDSEDAANGVSDKDRLDAALSLIKAIASWTDRD